jgi:cell division GTPase FtsZ
MPRPGRGEKAMPHDFPEHTDEPAQAGDPAHDNITAIIRAITTLVTGPLNLIGFDFADLRCALLNQGRAVFGQGEAEGPDRASRAVEAAFADLKRRLRQ